MTHRGGIEKNFPHVVCDSDGPVYFDSSDYLLHEGMLWTVRVIPVLCAVSSAGNLPTAQAPTWIRIRHATAQVQMEMVHVKASTLTIYFLNSGRMPGVDTPLHSWLDEKSVFMQPVPRGIHILCNSPTKHWIISASGPWPFWALTEPPEGESSPPEHQTRVMWTFTLVTARSWSWCQHCALVCWAENGQIWQQEVGLCNGIRNGLLRGQVASI